MCPVLRNIDIPCMYNDAASRPEQLRVSLGYIVINIVYRYYRCLRSTRKKNVIQDSQR